MKTKICRILYEKTVNFYDEICFNTVAIRFFCAGIHLKIIA